MLAAHRRRVIGAQQATFTIHGVLTDPLEEVFARASQEKAAMLTRIDLDLDTPQEVEADLARLGITEYLFFPELSSITAELKKHFSRAPKGAV